MLATLKSEARRCEEERQREAAEATTRAAAMHDEAQELTRRLKEAEMRADGAVVKVSAVTAAAQAEREVMEAAREHEIRTAVAEAVAAQEVTMR